MNTLRPFEITILAIALIAGLFLFIQAWRLADAVPVEYRSASPGFNWGWEYDYEGAMRGAGRFGGEPRPWPAIKIGNQMVLPLNQPLVTGDLEMTYKGMVGSDGFRLDIVFQRLDSGVNYPQEFRTSEARKVMFIDDQQFVLDTITPHYIRLRTIGQQP